jgi:CBS domain-containing protein
LEHHDTILPQNICHFLVENFDCLTVTHETGHARIEYKMLTAKEETIMAKVENRTLREIMTKDLATVTLKDNVYEVACKMRDWNVGMIPVVDEKDDVIGVITDRDIVIRGLAEKREGSAAVETVMTRDIILGRPDMTVDEAAKIMAQHQIRRLPVVDNGKLVGIVALGDMAVRQVHHDEASDALAEISEPATRH